MSAHYHFDWTKWGIWGNVKKNSFINKAMENLNLICIGVLFMLLVFFVFIYLRTNKRLTVSIKENEAWSILYEYYQYGNLENLKYYHEEMTNLLNFLDDEVSEKIRYYFFIIFEERLSEIIKPQMNIENSHLRIKSDLLSSKYEYHKELEEIKRLNNLFDIIKIYEKYCDTFESSYFVLKLNNTVLDIFKNTEKYLDLEGNISSGCMVRIWELRDTIKAIPLISDDIRAKLLKIYKDIERTVNSRPF